MNSITFWETLPYMNKTNGKVSQKVKQFKLFNLETLQFVVVVVVMAPRNAKVSQKVKL